MKETKKIEDFIQKHYKQMTNKELADELKKQGVTVSAPEVQAVLRRLGLSRKIEGVGALPSRMREVESLTLTAERLKESDVFENAVKAYEAAIKLLEKKKCEQAEKAFADVVSAYAKSEPELAERARMYAKIAARFAAEKTAPAPKSFDDFYLAALAAMNMGRLDEAESLAEKARGKAQDASERGAAHYVLASIAIKRDEASVAAQHLERAIAEDDRYRHQCRYDFDFADRLREPALRAVLDKASGEGKRK